MESAMGQVEKVKKERYSQRLFRFIKHAKQQQEQNKMRQEYLLALDHAKSEFERISNHLAFITDSDAKEYCIYRLKAAELNFNRHIKLAKSAHAACVPSWEKIQ